MELKIIARRGLTVMVATSTDAAERAAVVSPGGGVTVASVASALKFGYWADPGPERAGDAELVKAAREALGA